ncbi:MAG: ABC transporter ATP-binding protein [Thermoproteales archaeon]|nr:ABC transporter ATP-binding protein [Thermoproteales archaeon]
MESLQETEQSNSQEEDEIILSIRNLTIDFKVPRGLLRAVDKLNLDVYKGECLGIVGESGSGKSVLAHAILRLKDPNEIIRDGKILFEGRNVFEFSDKELREYRWKDVSIVFQGALTSLNPVLRVISHMVDTAEAHGIRDKKSVIKKATELLEMVRLDSDVVLRRYQHELSGGMKQRVVSALALLLDPKLVILDEPTSALDMLTQKFFVKILAEIKRKKNITMMFITHDIATVAEIADRVAVMYAGKVIEVGPVEEIFYNPLHPYTKALLNSIPSVVGDVSQFKPIPGIPPDPVNPPPGCRFHPRCPFATDTCSKVEPNLEKIGYKRWISCHRWREINHV